MERRKNLKKVLLVDDDEIIRTLLKLFLTGFPLTFWEESDGRGALHLAKQIYPDLIITDLLMPKMDGSQLTASLRSETEPRLSKVPIIVITGTSADDRDKAYQAGANIVLEKPVVRKLLLTAIEQFLPK